MASATLERAVEVVEEKPAEAKVSVEDLAKGESRAKVEGNAFTGAARAWNAVAQID